MSRLLLISSSRTYGSTYLEHCLSAVEKHLQGVTQLLFVPFALSDHDGYVATVRNALKSMPLAIDSLHEAKDPAAAIFGSQAIFVGGGNTFRLLNTLYRLELIGQLRDCVREGTPYMGSSAGTNLACPTIGTTNDMPIVEPPSFRALNLVPFQINPHYLDAPADARHQGETRQQRIAEYLEENDRPVLGIREGCWLEIEGGRGRLGGYAGAVLFRRNHPPLSMQEGELLDDLLAV